MFNIATGFKVDFYWYQLGTSDFVHSFFSTISFHLEKEGWGTKYPHLMKELYSGKLPFESIPKAIEESKEIHEKLKLLSPSEVVWDIEDLSKQPPWGDNISSNITDLSNYFVTSDGKDMFEILFYALNEALEENTDLEIKTL